MPWKDPNNYSYQVGFTLSCLILGVWGGIVSVYRSRQQGKKKKWIRYFGEMFLSITAAFIAGLLCHYFQVDAEVVKQGDVFFVFNYPMTCLSMWMASALGTRLFDLMDELYCEGRIEILSRLKKRVANDEA